jgi:hypothetical protein
MPSSTELERARAYHDEAIRLRCEAEIADEVLIRHQLRDIAQRYDLMAKTVEMIEVRDPGGGFPFEHRGPGLHRAA